MNNNSLACPKCGLNLSVSRERLSCPQCQLNWPIREGIPRFVDQPYYWGEIPCELMQEINQLALKKGWLTALNELLLNSNPQIYEYATDSNRADFSYYIRSNPEGTVLDIGSGWGTISCLLAPLFGQILSVESVSERIEFLQIRSNQENLSNVQPIQASFLDLPIHECSLDLVVMNGVLEWIGIGSEQINPETMQENVLTKIYNSLKPGGQLYIGIENRFAFNYFFGAYDHSGMPYTSLMPRSLADKVVSWNRKTSYRTEQGKFNYRTYTYSYWGYKAKLRKIGFDRIKIYLIFPDYNQPAYFVPAENTRAFSYLVEKLYSGDSLRRTILRKLAILTAPLGLQKLFAPSFGIFATKD